MATALLLTSLSGCDGDDDAVAVQNDSDTPPVTNPPVTNPPVTQPPVTSPPDEPDEPDEPSEPITPNPNGDTGVTIDPPVYRNDSVFVPNATDIGDYNAFYTQDGYATPNVIRMDVRVQNTQQGICTIDDQSGCTLADVLADIDGNDDFKVEIPIHASSPDLPDDGSVTNATLRQRGNTARFGPQKSFRLKLDSKEDLWRNERRLQLNKNPFEPTRYKNKLSFDLFTQVPHLPSLRTQFVNLWINNGNGLEDFGLFTHTEFVGKEYVRNRRLGEDDNLYKIEFFRFSQGDLNSIRVDAEGKPLDEDAFATRLEIENGKDHRALVRMMEAMVDPARSFDSVLDEYFNRNNVLTWLATNLILRQADAITHNFYIYNPAGTERFYFLPWDYDGTFEAEQILTNSFANEDLQKRKFYGYARGGNSVFVDRYYRLPGVHEQFVRAIDELRANYYSDEQILERAKTLNLAVEPFLTRLPDSEHVRFEEFSPERLVSVINQNYDSITNDYDIPIEPTILRDPEIDESGVLQLEWEPAFDVTRQNTLTYDLIISSSELFEPDSTLFSDTGIADVSEGLISYPVNTAVLQSGRVFVRVVARASRDPERIWQTNSNVYRLSDGTEYFGMLAVDIP
ncbi:MAG: CotH kinase family protein [Granulosicoccus sp.]